MVRHLPPAMGETTVWQTHALAHSEVGKMIGRLQLTWFCPGLASTVRRLIKSCELCQAAKHGGTKRSEEKGGSMQDNPGKRWPWI